MYSSALSAAWRAIQRLCRDMGERSVSMKSSKQWPLWEAQVGGHTGASWGILGLFSKLVGGLFQPYAYFIICMYFLFDFKK